MLAKDPTQRISADNALKHDWITSNGVGTRPFVSSGSFTYLSSAQENMKRFQEE